MGSVIWSWRNKEGISHLLFVSVSFIGDFYTHWYQSYLSSSLFVEFEVERFRERIILGCGRWNLRLVELPSLDKVLKGRWGSDWIWSNSCNYYSFMLCGWSSLLSVLWKSILTAAIENLNFKHSKLWEKLISLHMMKSRQICIFLKLRVSMSSMQNGTPIRDNLNLFDKVTAK